MITIYSIVTVALLVSGVAAFAPSSPSLVVRGMASSAVDNKSTSLFSEPAKVRSFLRCGLSFSFPTLTYVINHLNASFREGGGGWSRPGPKRNV